MLSRVQRELEQNFTEYSLTVGLSTELIVVKFPPHRQIQGGVKGAESFVRAPRSKYLLGRLRRDLDQNFTEYSLMVRLRTELIPVKLPPHVQIQESDKWANFLV